MDAALGEHCHVRLRCRVQPHADVHRGRDQHRFVRREQHGRGKVIGQSGSHFRQDIRRGRHHDQQVGGAGELDVPHLRLVGQREQIRIDFRFAQRLKRQGCDELGAVLGQDAGNTIAGAPEQSD